MTDDIDYKALYELVQMKNLRLEEQNIELIKELDKYKIRYSKKSTYEEDMEIIMNEVKNKKLNNMTTSSLAERIQQQLNDNNTNYLNEMESNSIREALTTYPDILLNADNIILNVEHVLSEFYDSNIKGLPSLIKLLDKIYTYVGRATKNTQQIKINLVKILISFFVRFSVINNYYQINDKKLPEYNKLLDDFNLDNEDIMKMDMNNTNYTTQDVLFKQIDISIDSYACLLIKKYRR